MNRSSPSLTPSDGGPPPPVTSRRRRLAREMTLIDGGAAREDDSRHLTGRREPAQRVIALCHARSMPASTAELGELRPLMFSIAYRMLGSVTEAEDVVQDAYLRLHERSLAGEVDRTTRGLRVDRRHAARDRRAAVGATQPRGLHRTWLPEPLPDDDADPAHRIDATRRSRSPSSPCSSDSARSNARCSCCARCSTSTTRDDRRDRRSRRGRVPPDHAPGKARIADGRPRFDGGCRARRRPRSTRSSPRSRPATSTRS